MKVRVYFDTSVFGGIYDEEFKTETELLFEMVKSGQIICVFSELTVAELENAPKKIRRHFLELPTRFLEKVEVSREAIQLADKYISEKVVGETSLADCRHIATATVNKVDYLISWSFKHIVNVFRIRGYNAINIKNGHIQ